MSLKRCIELMSKIAANHDNKQEEIDLNRLKITFFKLNAVDKASFETYIRQNADITTIKILALIQPLQHCLSLTAKFRSIFLEEGETNLTRQCLNAIKDQFSLLTQEDKNTYEQYVLEQASAGGLHQEIKFGAVAGIALPIIDSMASGSVGVARMSALATVGFFSSAIAIFLKDIIRSDPLLEEEIASRPALQNIDYQLLLARHKGSFNEIARCLSFNSLSEKLLDKRREIYLRYENDDSQGCRRRR